MIMCARAGARETHYFNYFNYFKHFFTYSVISIHDQCLYIAFEHSFHQCNITEIKPQVGPSHKFPLILVSKKLFSFWGAQPPRVRPPALPHITVKINVHSHFITLVSKYFSCSINFYYNRYLNYLWKQ